MQDEIMFTDEEVRKMRLLELGFYTFVELIKEQKEEEMFMEEQGIY